MNAQATFEDVMSKLEASRKEATANLIKTKETLAQKEEDLVENEKDLKATIKMKNETEAYLESIKEGCDFFTDNFADREQYRKDEISSLESAKTMLKETPIFKQAVQKAED